MPLEKEDKPARGVVRWLVVNPDVCEATFAVSDKMEGGRIIVRCRLVHNHDCDHEADLPPGAGY